MAHRASERIVAGLWQLIGMLVDPLKLQECCDYTSLCGYGVD